MKAVILATNESTNLTPLTDVLPGSMLPLPGKPLMAYTLELLARAGINEIVVCLHRMGGNIEAWFGSGRRWGVNIEYSLQRDSLGDAGALRWAKGIINDRFILLPSNSLHDLNIEQLIHSHEQSGNLATIVTGKRVSPNHAPDSKPSEHTGAYIFEPELLDLIPNKEIFDIQTQLIPLLQAKQVDTNYFNHTGYWNPIQSFQDLKEVQDAYLISACEKLLKTPNTQLPPTTLQYPSISGNRFGNDVWAGQNNIIHPSVRIFPPVVIGSNCQIGNDVELGPFTIIGSDIIIDDEASIKQSTVTDKTYIGKLVNVENKFVARNLMVDVPTNHATYIADKFLIGAVSPPIINKGLRIFLDKVLAIFLILLLTPFLILLSLVSLISTGRILKIVQRVGIIPSEAISGSVLSPERIELRHFSTRRDNQPNKFTGWIERSGLYRLPELFSIVAGHLSFVGVKPLLPEEADLLIEEWQQQRYSFSAGFTGLWYTEDAGLNKDDATLIYDIYYVAIRNFKEDLRILVKTPARWAKNLLFF